MKPKKKTAKKRKGMNIDGLKPEDFRAVPLSELLGTLRKGAKR